MTDAAARFVTPLTFRTLTGEPVASSLWEEPAYGRVHHVSLAAGGRRDGDRAVHRQRDRQARARPRRRHPHDHRARHRGAARHRARDERRDVAQGRDAAPTSTSCARAASSSSSPRAASSPAATWARGGSRRSSDIAEAVEAEARRARDLAGVRVLVTAGGTREAIDPVRFIGNRSSRQDGLRDRRGGRAPRRRRHARERPDGAARPVRRARSCA